MDDFPAPTGLKPHPLTRDPSPAGQAATIRVPHIPGIALPATGITAPRRTMTRPPQFNFCTRAELVVWFRRYADRVSRLGSSTRYRRAEETESRVLIVHLDNGWNGLCDELRLTLYPPHCFTASSSASSLQ
jgi:hypothetical protein